MEPAIAASIVYVAIENFFSRNVDGRWRDTFAFGLVHGFGFASALQEFGLPRGAVVPALAAFNIGVEVGQVAIVSLVIPLLIGVDWLIARMRGAPQDRTAALSLRHLRYHRMSGLLLVSRADGLGSVSPQAQMCARFSENKNGWQKLRHPFVKLDAIASNYS